MGASSPVGVRRSSSCVVGGEPSFSSRADVPLPSACASMFGSTAPTSVAGRQSRSRGSPP
eukprot:553984-Alexandrium_andersonii.AAC.1